MAVPFYICIHMSYILSSRTLKIVPKLFTNYWRDVRLFPISSSTSRVTGSHALHTMNQRTGRVSGSMTLNLVPRTLCVYFTGRPLRDIRLFPPSILGVNISGPSMRIYLSVLLRRQPSFSHEKQSLCFVPQGSMAPWLAAVNHDRIK